MGMTAICKSPREEPPFVAICYDTFFTKMRAVDKSLVAVRLAAEGVFTVQR